MVKEIGSPLVKVPAVTVTVNTNPASEAVPAAPTGAENATVGAGLVARVMPDPTRVMTTLPLAGVTDCGVSETDKLTDADPATVLLRVMAGLLAPRPPGAVIAG